MLRFFLSVILIFLSVPAHALDLDELHLFTDKKGNQITAKLLEIDKEQLTAKIRRADGMEFSPEIVLFSLDDQQYIKDWMESYKLAAASELKDPEFHLVIEVDHEEISTDKHVSGSFVLESTPHFFEVKVLNTSRENLEGAVVEYVMVWEEGATIYEGKDDGEWRYTSPSRADTENLVRKHGSVPLEPLAFNREALIRTDQTPIDRVLDSEGDPFKEDLLLGVLVRVVGADGQILAENTTGKAELSSYTWEKSLSLASVEVAEE